MMTRERYERIGRILRRTIVVLLAVAAIDHFVYAFLPRLAAFWNLAALWALVGALVIVEIAAYVSARKARGAGDADDDA